MAFGWEDCIYPLARFGSGWRLHSSLLCAIMYHYWHDLYNKESHLERRNEYMKKFMKLNWRHLKSSRN